MTMMKISLQIIEMDKHYEGRGLNMDLIRYSKEDEEGFMKDILKLVSQQIFFPGAEIETMKNGEHITLSRLEMQKLIKIKLRNTNLSLFTLKKTVTL